MLRKAFVDKYNDEIAEKELSVRKYYKSMRNREDGEWIADIGKWF